MGGQKLVVGLGNPGSEYRFTRHNLGFMVVEAFAAGAEFRKSRHARALVARMEQDGGAVVLVEPQTYMNLSGQAVKALVDYEQIDIQDVLVVCDDIRLEFGQIRLRAEGSDGGHNGLKSVSACLGTDAYPRLRLGVGAPAAVERQSDYVLGGFGIEEKARLGAFIDEAAGCLKLWVAGHAAQAMTQYNKRKVNG